MPQNVKGEFKELPIDKVVPNTWNPNVMDEKEFNELAKNWKELPGAQPIAVFEQQDGTFMIFGGEHRWKAARLSGDETIGAMVYKLEDIGGTLEEAVDYLKFQTMRLNVIHGKTSPQKFIELYNSLSSKYQDDVMRSMMGFVDETEWNKLLAKVRSGLPNRELKERFDQVKEQIKTVEDLSTILNTLFTQYGSTLPYQFMVFDFGGKENLWVRMGKPLYSTMRMLGNECVEKKVTMDAFMNELLIVALNRKDEVQDIFNRLPKVQFKEGTKWPTESQVKD